MPARSSPSPSPHIGNVGTNDEDIETVNLAAASGVRGCVSRPPSPTRRTTAPPRHLDDWLKARGIIGIAGIDTRALTALIREKGMPNAVIAHAPTGLRPRRAEAKAAAGRAWSAWTCAKDVTCDPALHLGRDAVGGARATAAGEPGFHVVAIDYGIKRNILRCSPAGCRVTVVPATDQRPRTSSR
jgi:carbamoyl-phosphate synthase small subunit